MNDSLRVVAIIQARMSSQRLPGKSLATFAGSTLIGQVVDRVRASAGLDATVLATSTDRSDDRLEDFARQAGLPCFRGDLHDVTRRLIDAGTAHAADAIVRICGDSPLIDPAIIAASVSLFRALRPDLVSNVLPRSFPKGQSVEVIRLQTLHREWSQGMNAEQCEHVTTRFHDCPERFSIVRIAQSPAADAVQLSVDTAADLEHLAALADRLASPGRRPCLAEILDAGRQAPTERR